MEWIALLLAEFENHANTENAFHQKKYLKDLFEFYGLKTTERRQLQKPFLERKFLPPKKELNTIVKNLWGLPQRECHYFAQELAALYNKQIAATDIQLYEFMITHNSWWDTVDFIANHLVGAYFKKFSKEKERHVKKWLDSENIWLQRTALIFQLKYKSELDTKILTTCITSLSGSKEFFINKAIGWMLREYSKTNPQWVQQFIDQQPLSNLSKREASKFL